MATTNAELQKRIEFLELYVEYLAGCLVSSRKAVLMPNLEIHHPHEHALQESLLEPKIREMKNNG